MFSFQRELLPLVKDSQTFLNVHLQFKYKTFYRVLNLSLTTAINRKKIMSKLIRVIFTRNASQKINTILGESIFF